MIPQPAPVRWSNLRWMQRSPQHYRYYLDNPVQETAYMRVGAFTHHLVLGGSRLFEVWDGQRRGKEWEKFRDAQPEGVTILNATEALCAQEMAHAIRADARAVELLTGTPEKTIRWRIGDRECEGTPDVFGSNYVTDLKLTHDASPERFPWHARRMGWTTQSPWYGDGLVKNGCAIEHHYIVAVESKPPYPLVCYELEQDPERNAVEVGRKHYRLLFERLRACEETGEWPGYAQSIVPIYALEESQGFSLTVEGEEVEVE